MLISTFILLSFVSEHPIALRRRTARKFGYDISVRCTSIVWTDWE